MTNLFNIGIILLFIALLLIIVGSLQQNKNNVQASGGIFLGPIPLFGFGNKKIFFVLWILAIIIFILMLIFFRRP